MAEKIYVSGLSVIQKLYEAACAVVSSGLLPTYTEEQTEARLGLIRAVQDIEEEERTSQRLEAVRDAAMRLFACDDIDQCSTMTHHNGADGYWVTAWLYVSEEEVRTETTCQICSAEVYLHPGVDPRHADEEMDQNHTPVVIEKG